MRADISIVRQYADSLRFPLSEPILERLDHYLETLLEWRNRINLIGSTTSTAIVVDHFCDAVAAISHAVISHGARAVDVGSGAGLPGIPIAIMRPDLDVTLVEAMRKRAAFLEHARRSLDANWTVVWGRAELLAREGTHRGRYDVAFERAVAPIDRSFPLVLPLVSVGGLAIFMKGSDAIGDTYGIESALDRLGGMIESTITYSLPGAIRKARTLILVRKTNFGSTR